jgi:hypothetical protein
MTKVFVYTEVAMPVQLFTEAERALEHDKPTLLYELPCEKLRTDQFLRPGVTRLERLVAEARARA